MSRTGLRLVVGDVLADDADAVVNPVNCVGVMGAGLARQFARAYPAMDAAYRHACRARQVQPGRMFVWPTGRLAPRYIVCFPTKQHWRDASRLEYIDAGLADLCAVITRHRITSIAVPALGCSHGGLRWNDVGPRITAALGYLDGVAVRVYPPTPTATPTGATGAAATTEDHDARWSGCEPCTGCRSPRHPTVGATPCAVCGAVRWTLAITGSRSLTDVDRVRAAARSALAELVGRFGCRPRLVLHGNAPGVDRILAARLVAARWPVEAVPADWDRHGRKAGVLRDLSMVGRADALLAIWDGTSAGTAHTVRFARDRGLPIARRVLTLDNHHDHDANPHDRERDRGHRRAPRRRPTGRDGRSRPPQARTLPGIMACQPSTRAADTRPDHGRPRRPSAARLDYGASRKPAALQATFGKILRGFHYAPRSARVWDFHRGRGAARLPHPPASHSATSSSIPHLVPVGC